MPVRAFVNAERTHVSHKLFLASHFSTLPKWKFLEKGSLTKTCREFVTPLALLLGYCLPRVRDFVGAASALLASACVPSSSQRGFGRRSVWAFFWHGACARIPGYCSWSVQTRGLNSVATCASGVLGGIIRQRWLAHRVVIACPCWSLEGLLFATQKSCLRKS